MWRDTDDNPPQASERSLNPKTKQQGHQNEDPESAKNQIKTQRNQVRSQISSVSSKIPESIQGQIKKVRRRRRNQRIQLEFSEKSKEQSQGQQKQQEQICPICQMGYSKNEMETFGKCQHIFCSQCLTFYATYKIQRFQDLRCAQGQCDEPVDTEKVFFQELTPKEKRQYTKISNFYKTLKNPSLRLCPNKKCEEGILQIKQGQSQTECKSCNNRFCSKCFFPSHHGNCDDNEIKFFRELHLKQCQNCKMMIERKLGCNHMKCLCRYEFCFVCQNKWTDQHYNCKIVQPRTQENHQCLSSVFKTIIKILLCFPSFLILILFFIIFSIILFVTFIPFLMCFGWIYFSVCFILDEVEKIWKKVLLFVLLPLMFPFGLYRTFTNQHVQQFFRSIYSYQMLENIVTFFFRW